MALGCLHCFLPVTTHAPVPSYALARYDAPQACFPFEPACSCHGLPAIPPCCRQPVQSSLFFAVWLPLCPPASPFSRLGLVAAACCLIHCQYCTCYPPSGIFSRPCWPCTPLRCLIALKQGGPATFLAARQTHMHPGSPASLLPTFATSVTHMAATILNGRHHAIIRTSYCFFHNVFPENVRLLRGACSPNLTFRHAVFTMVPSMCKR